MQHSERWLQERTCDSIVEELRKISDNMHEVIQHVDLFSKWWSQMELRLASIKRAVEGNGLATDDVNMNIVAAVKEKWERTAEQHRQYILEVSLRYVAGTH